MNLVKNMGISNPLKARFTYVVISFLCFSLSACHMGVEHNSQNLIDAQFDASFFSEECSESYLRDISHFIDSSFHAVTEGVGVGIPDMGSPAFSPECWDQLKSLETLYAHRKCKATPLAFVRAALDQTHFQQLRRNEYEESQDLAAVPSFDEVLNDEQLFASYAHAEFRKLSSGLAPGITVDDSFIYFDHDQFVQAARKNLEEILEMFQMEIPPSQS